MNFLDKLFTEATLFENLETQGYSDLIIALKLADEKITDRILKTKGEWTKSKLNEIKRLINDEITKAYGGLFGTLQDEVVETANLAYGYMLGTFATRLPKKVLEELVNSNRDIQGYTFKELFKLNEDNHARQLRVVLASGVAQGLTVDQIINNYNIKSDKLSKGVIAGNIFTVLAETRQQAHFKAYKDLEDMGVVEKYEYNSVLDSNTTLYCREHDGKIYDSIEAISKDIKVHFRCRSMALPLGEDTDPSLRASETGLTQQKTFEDWFINAPREVQKATLTNKKYEALLLGKYKVKSLADINKKTNLATVKRVLENDVTNGNNI